MGAVGGVAGGIPGGVVGGVVGGIPPPPPPPPAAPIRVGGDIKAPTLLKRVEPTYPPFAVKAKVQGNVYLDAVIGKDGSVTNVTVTGGNDMLKQAAIDAVKQWKYTPTLLGGVPVEVALYVQVFFQLNK
jgi:protein TonB